MTREADANLFTQYDNQFMHNTTLRGDEYSFQVDYSKRCFEQVERYQKNRCRLHRPILQSFQWTRTTDAEILDFFKNRD